MPGGYPIGWDVCNGTDVGTALASTDGTQMTKPGSANTKAAFTQLIASTAADACFALIWVEPASGTTPINMLVDIAVGGAGSEQVICSNLVASCPVSGNGRTYWDYLVPLAIPAGTRISGRFQSDVTGTFANCNLNVTLFDGAFTQIEGAAGVEMIGASTTTSLLTAITPSATTDTKGSYSQLIASTARDYIGVVPVMNTAQADGNYMVDFAIGGAGSERIIIPNLPYTNANTASVNGGTSGFFPIAIPAGTRVAARAQDHNASGAAINVGLAGVFL